MPSSQTTMKTKTKARLKKSREIITLDTLHSHVTLGMVGVIAQVLKDGYAVAYPATTSVGLFGGDKVRKPTTVFMRPTDIRYYTKEDKRREANALAAEREKARPLVNESVPNPV